MNRPTTSTTTYPLTPATGMRQGKPPAEPGQIVADIGNAVVRATGDPNLAYVVGSHVAALAQSVEYYTERRRDTPLYAALRDLLDAAESGPTAKWDRFASPILAARKALGRNP